MQPNNLMMTNKVLLGDDYEEAEEQAESLGFELYGWSKGKVMAEFADGARQSIPFQITSDELHGIWNRHKEIHKTFSNEGIANIKRRCIKLNIDFIESAEHEWKLGGNRCG